MARISGRLRIRYFAVLTAFLVVSLYFLHAPVEQTQWNSTFIDSVERDSQEESHLFRADKDKIRNGTLGFGAIYAVGLPERTDKRDGMSLAASLTNLRLTWRDGVKGDMVHPKAIPPAHLGEGEFTRDGEVGCWRGHMNVIREIATSGIGSALVLEDDTDWDVNITKQAEKLAIAVQDTISQLPKEQQKCSPDSDSPYGSCWDILWIGHCGGWPPGKEYRQYSSVIRGDNTMPPVFDIEDLTNDLAPLDEPCAGHPGHLPEGVVCESPRLSPDERIVQYKGSPICTFGYAVSQRGARKMLARLGGLSLVDVDANLDTEMTEMCRGDKDIGNRETMQCLTISPPIIMTHRARGPKNTDSDIQDTGNQMDQRVLGITKGAMFSTRLNAEALIAGREPVSQYLLDEGMKKWRYRKLEEYSTY
jgi:hypothetical protein